MDTNVYTATPYMPGPTYVQSQEGSQPLVTEYTTVSKTDQTMSLTGNFQDTPENWDDNLQNMDHNYVTNNEQFSQIPNQDHIASLDSQLINKPKDNYIDIILNLTNHDENTLSWYRATLVSRARSIAMCPTGQAKIRKNSQRGTSSLKYANDCYTLNAFINGDTSSDIEDIFTKPTTKIPQPEGQTRIQAMADVQATLHTLTDRVNQLETKLTNTEKEIKDKNTVIKSLQTTNNSLKQTFDEFKTEMTAKCNHLDSFRKQVETTLNIFGEFDFDINEYRLKQISSNVEKIQSKLSSHQTVKTKDSGKQTSKGKLQTTHQIPGYSGNVFADKTVNDSSDGRSYDDNKLDTESTITIDSNVSMDNDTLLNDKNPPSHHRAAHVNTPVTTLQPATQTNNKQTTDSHTTLSPAWLNYRQPETVLNLNTTTERNAVPVEKRLQNIAQCTTYSTQSKDGSSENAKSTTNYTKSRATTSNHRQSSNEGIQHTTEYGHGENMRQDTQKSSQTNQYTYTQRNNQKRTNDKQDTFRGITNDDGYRTVDRRSTVRLYISNIHKASTYWGFMTFLKDEQKLTPSAVKIFHSKRNGHLAARINLPAHEVQTVESTSFPWPEGVKCERWLSKEEVLNRYNKDTHKGEFTGVNNYKRHTNGYADRSSGDNRDHYDTTSYDPYQGRYENGDTYGGYYGTNNNNGYRDKEYDYDNYD